MPFRGYYLLDKSSIYYFSFRIFAITKKQRPIFTVKKHIHFLNQMQLLNNLTIVILNKNQ
jgi:hypothetical protein